MSHLTNACGAAILALVHHCLGLFEYLVMFSFRRNYYRMRYVICHHIYSQSWRQKYVICKCLNLGTELTPFPSPLYPQEHAGYQVLGPVLERFSKTVRIYTTWCHIICTLPSQEWPRWKVTINSPAHFKATVSCGCIDLVTKSLTPGPGS